MKNGIVTSLLALATLAVFSQSPARADVIIAGYLDATCSQAQATACQTLTGVTATDLDTSGDGAAGPAYFVGPDTSSQFSFSVTGFTGYLDTLTFGESNNDYCYGCSNWSVTESIDGGNPVDVLDFYGGLPNTEYDFAAPLGQNVSATDTIAFTISMTGYSGDGGTDQYGFDTIELNGVTPEPASFVLIGTGLAFGAFLRKRIC